MKKVLKKIGVFTMFGAILGGLLGGLTWHPGDIGGVSLLGSIIVSAIPIAVGGAVVGIIYAAATH